MCLSVCLSQSMCVCVRAHTHTHTQDLPFMSFYFKADITALGIPESDTNTVTTVTTTGNGNAITAISATNGAITATKGATFLTSHPSITAGTNSTTTASPAFGGSFTVVGSVTKEANGHVTAIETKTVTLPSLSFETTALDLSTLA